MIVVDASAAVSALLRRGQARTMLMGEQLHVPHLVDTEVAQALRRHAASGLLSPGSASRRLRTWSRLAMTRYPVFALVDRIWQLRDNVTAYDACYVAIAEQLDCALVTADHGLARAPGIRCAITVVPR